MSQERLNQQLKETAAAFIYPPTPDIATKVQRQLTIPRQQAKPLPSRRYRLALTLLALLLLLSSLLAIPPVRATLLEMFNIGAINIFVNETPPLATPSATSITDLGTPTTLAKAQDKFPIPLQQLPTLPPPDWIYIQQLLDQAPVVTFVWLAQPNHPQITLSQIPIAQFATKWGSGEQIEEVFINGRSARWIEGPHTLRLADAHNTHIPITTNVLIWSQDNVTYRLEGDITRQEALTLIQSQP